MECEQRLNWLILAMMFPLIAGAPSSMSKRHESCPEENLSITGGSFVLSNGYSDGSFLRYICPNGYYPSVQSRRCKYGLWTPKTSTRKPPECKKVTCPNPRVLENGEVTPYKYRYYVNDTTTYSCNSDYKFCGSAVRVCKPNGKWSGSTPICGRDSDHCPDPGVPPGSSRTGHMFNIDDKVTYVCDSALTLIGSKERVCQDNGRWSGTEPECYAHFTYDTPEEASEAFSSALKSNLELSQQYEEEDQQGKKITQGGKLDIYIAVDSSDIINKDDFDKAKNTIKKLIETISYYQVSPNYEILMFASDVYRISSIRDFKSKRNLTQVFEELDNINFEHYTDGTGTNIAKLYSAILGSMELEELNDTKGFLETQNIIIVFTDGKANMGGNPIHKVNHIKYLVTKNNPKREKKLDLFVLGIGDDVNQENMNGLVSQRDQEKYFFKLSDLDEAQKMFDSMIDAASSNLCSDENLSIRGGSFSISKDRSLVRYSCSEGYYPTIKIRRCNKGRWNPMPKRKPPDCKKVTCPDPHGFENGEVYPYSPRYFVNDTTHYSCHSSYIFRGSATRVCQLNGKWSGSTPVCGRNSDHCPDPGTPAGSTRTGNIFNIDDKVTYHCDRALTLIGSKERVCQDDGQWSGTEPECYADFTYDTPEEASEGFSSSLQSNLVLSQQHEGTDQYGKKIQVQKGGKLDIYIALDVSDSIEEDTFEMAKDVIKTLIEKISYYEVSPNYEILIFATDVHRIVSMRDFKSGQGNNLLHILKRLENYKYESKGDRSGTNIAQTYRKILESMQIEQMTNREDFMQTQHIVIMFTDGQANMGGNPKLPVDQIKNLVIQNNPSREDKLELYVFGMGDDVNAEDINDLKTNRGNEKFFFKLLNFEELKETFDNMIDEGTSVALCGLYRDYDDGFPSHERRQYPWLAKITVTHNNGKISNCMGSLVTSSFILTAAHCFRFGDTPDRITVNIGSTIRGNKVKQYIPHPHYNLHAKQHMGIPEYYEFDVALIQLEKPVIMGIDLRPICIPCTKETSGALRLSEREGTCRKHQDVLLSAETVNAAFMTDRKRSIEKKFIQIKQGKWRDACVEDAKKAEGITATNADDIVTENFLCSGGIEPSRDDIACRGDSGGATFVVPGNRMIQVGIISWGVKDLCARNPSASSDAQSRDYHTSLFSAEVRSFLKDYLGNGTLGTPLTFL